jgi:hypothetical protein
MKKVYSRVDLPPYTLTDPELEAITEGWSQESRDGLRELFQSMEVDRQEGRAAFHRLLQCILDSERDDLKFKVAMLRQAREAGDIDLALGHAVRLGGELDKVQFFEEFLETFKRGGRPRGPRLKDGEQWVVDGKDRNQWLKEQSNRLKVEHPRWTVEKRCKTIGKELGRLSDGKTLSWKAIYKIVK